MSHTLKTQASEIIFLKISLDVTNDIVEFGYEKNPTMGACSFKDKQRNFSMSSRNRYNRQNYQ